MIIHLISILIFAMLGSTVLVYFKEGADMVLSLNKGFLFGISSAKSYYELEKETDYSYQVALGVLVITLTWTRTDAE